MNRKILYVYQVNYHYGGEVLRIFLQAIVSRVLDVKWHGLEPSGKFLGDVWSKIEVRPISVTAVTVFRTRIPSYSFVLQLMQRLSILFMILKLSLFRQ